MIRLGDYTVELETGRFIVHCNDVNVSRIDSVSQDVAEKMFLQISAMRHAIIAFKIVNEKHGYEFDSNEPEVFNTLMACIENL